MTGFVGAGSRRPAHGIVPVTATQIGTIALRTAVPPFATDTDTPSFPRVTADPRVDPSA